MKNLFLIACIFPTILIGQNIEDAYQDHKGDIKYSNSYEYYEGEYQVMLDKLYWEMDVDFSDAAKSLSIKVVSFPFIPRDLQSNDTNTSQHLHSDTTRFFDIQQMENNISNLSQSSGSYSYEGYGWDFGNWNIYSKVNNTNTCDYANYSMCYGDYGLISAGFVESIPYYGHKDCWLPHTILKHTLYFHCGESITDPIIDSISWIYDNTRGTMSRYPFNDENSDCSPPLLDKYIDVCYRPSFMNGLIIYNPTVTDSNSVLYDSGIDPNTGSVNYYPPDEVSSNYMYSVCEDTSYKLYYNPENPDGGFWQNNDGDEFYDVSWVHPPVYALNDSPLLNFDGTAWAGYEGSQADSMPGIKHVYEINDAIDLKEINPSEKIIYNPSHVNINVDLTFPNHYKFITLHGKYPDKEQEVFHYFNNYWMYYWSGTVNFCNDREILAPVNYLTNKEFMSIYQIKSGKTLTIEPCVIIMNAYFQGESSVNRSYIAYDTNQHLGNWEFDPNTIEIIPQNYTGPEGYACQWYCPPEKMYPISEDNMSKPDDANADFVKITNKESNVVNFEINVAREGNIRLVIYNSYGVLIKEVVNPARNFLFNGSGFSSGIYIAQVRLNNEVLEVEKFYLIE